MKYIKNNIAILLAFVVGIAPLGNTLASTIRDANNKKNEAQEALRETQNDIYQIESQQQALQAEIDSLDAELVNVIMNLNILESDLVAKEKELVKVQKKLTKAQKTEDKQYALMKKRIRFMYERGDSAMLTSILQSKTITDLLNRVEYVNEIYEADRTLLTTYQETKKKVAALEVQVQGEIAEMEEMQANFKEEQQRYETIIAKKQSEIDNFDVQLADAKQLAAQYQATINEQNEIIRREEERKRREEEERRRQEEANRQEQANSNSNTNTNNSSNSSNSGSGSSSDSGAGKNPGYATNVSTGSVVDYACQFIGNPYVWGGTNPNTGADCSGFVQYVYRQFGVSLPRGSWEQRYAGKEVSYANAKPGDIICYSGHVAIYMGNGQIVHASSSAPYPIGGIKTGTATYRTIISVRRVL